MRLEKTPRPGPDLGAGCLTHSCLLPHAHGGPPPSPSCCFSYLGDLSEDDPSVLFALSQSLHASQEFFPLLDFLYH